MICIEWPCCTRERLAIFVGYKLYANDLDACVCVCVFWLRVCCNVFHMFPTVCVRAHIYDDQWSLAMGGSESESVPCVYECIKSTNVFGNTLDLAEVQYQIPNVPPFETVCKLKVVTNFPPQLTKKWIDKFIFPKYT